MQPGDPVGGRRPGGSPNPMDRPLAYVTAEATMA